MKVYEGIRTDDGCHAHVDGRPLNMRLDLRKHADRPEWGYAGSGPAQLALALLADALGDDVAMEHQQKFKRGVVAGLEREGWIMTQAVIRSWVAQALGDRGDSPEGFPGHE